MERLFLVPTNNNAMNKFRLTSSAAFVAAFMSREEALFWLGLAITVLQMIYAFYEVYTERKLKTKKGEADTPE